MKCSLISDLHLDHYTSVSIEKIVNEIPKCDLLLLAGDISTSIKKLKFFFDLISKDIQVLYVLGNHEYYGNSFQTHKTNLKSKIATYSNVFLLENESKEIENYNFYGCTLWTSYDDLKDLSFAKIAMPDFKCIKGITEKSFYNYHLNSLKKLTNFLEDKENKIIITHHAPSYNSVSPKYRGNLLNSSFVNDLTQLIIDHEPICWCHGHVHDSFEYNIYRTKVLCNPYGYPFENNNKLPKYKVFTIE